MTKNNNKHNQKKVAFTEKTTESKILDLLKRRYPNPQKIDNIAFSILESKKITGAILSKMLKKGIIIRISRGTYGIPAKESDIDLDWMNIKLHGIKIEAKTTKGVEGIFPQPFTTSTKERKTWKLKFRNHKVTITIHKHGLTEIFIKCTNNPLDLETFKAYLDWLEALFIKFPLKQKKLIQLGINIDTTRFTLDLPKSITIQEFQNSWSKIYQKTATSMRIEQHICTKIPLEQAIQIFHRLIVPHETKGSPFQWENGEMEYIR